uniref:Uncharacterized protein n=1 Tax=Romanomermis culicivorax TaxID=13658 RepID=A0A915JVR4_ROMCU
MHSAHITLAPLKIGVIGHGANGKTQMKSAHIKEFPIVVFLKMLSNNKSGMQVDSFLDEL